MSLEYLDTGAATTMLFLLQPEDADSTRIYTCLFLSAGPGQPLPPPAVVAEEVAFHRLVLEEDLGLMGGLESAGLPLDVREELHVPADRLGVALRRALCDFATARRARRRLSSPDQSAGSVGAAGRAAGGWVLVGHPPAGRADPAQPAGRVPALVVGDVARRPHASPSLPLDGVADPHPRRRHGGVTLIRNSPVAHLRQG